MVADNNHLSENSPIVQAFRKVHGSKYSYDKAIYTRASELIEITCPEHGSFKQTPNAHKRGQGCRACGNKTVGKKRTLDFEVVLKTFKLKHGEKYDYSLVQYTAGGEKVKIICPTHGVFEQTPNAHKNGQGCPRCSGRSKTIDELILEFKGVHGDRFDYAKVLYVSSATKITITCRKHGDFEQTPNSHLQGKGCRHCAIEERIKKIKKESELDAIG